MTHITSLRMCVNAKRLDWVQLKQTHFTYKSVQLPSEPPLMDASVQLKEFGDGPHGEDTLKETLQ